MTAKERMCCVCRTRKRTDNLIRVSRRKENAQTVFILDKQSANGRGAYICPDCVEKCIKTRALNRSFKNNIPNEIYEELRTAAIGPVLPQK
jgi:predicted RNA-binding protein YlxR (DUF448 family)